MTILKKYRIDNDISQEEMAKQLGVCISTLRLYDQGKRIMPVDVLNRFLKIRGAEDDLKLSKILEEVMHNGRQKNK